tara:strand:- start:300 stop:494 length:195 start_codon:yes stop_codon:yes gene_type:complete
MMAISEADLRTLEQKLGKEDPGLQLLRNSRMGQGQTAHDLYVTGSIKRPKHEVETAEEGSQDDT